MEEGLTVGFLSIGPIRECLKDEGKVPVEGERLKVLVSCGMTAGETPQIRCEGTGLEGQVIRRAEERSAETSYSVTAANIGK